MRKGTEMWEESTEVRPAHLLYEDLKQERTDIPKLTFYIWLQREYWDLRGFAPCGNFGYKIKWINPPTGAIQQL